MTEFGNKSGEVANNLAIAFDTFARIDADTTPDETWEQEALEHLRSAAESGQAMAKKSKELAEAFEKIISDCTEIIAEAIKKKVTDAQMQEELEAKLAELNSLMTATKALQENVQTALEQAEEAYTEAKEKEALENERGFITGLVGVIFTGLSSFGGSVAQTAIAIKSPVGLPGALGGAASTSSKPTGTQPQATNDEKNAETSEKLKKANKELLDLEKEQEKNETSIKQAEKVIKDSKSSEEAKQQAEAIKKEAEDKREDIKARLAVAQTAVDTLVQGALAVSQSLDQLSQNSYNAAAEASKQKMEFYKQKIKLAEENRKALKDIALYTSQVQYTTVDVVKIKTAIQSLEFAISALNGVVAALSETQRFWESLAIFCRDKLGSPTMQAKVESLLSKPATTRMNEYRDEKRFILPALQTIAYWVAVKNVSEEYQKAVYETYEQVLSNIKKRPLTVENAQNALPELAKKVLGATQSQEVAVNMDIAFYEEQMLQSAVAYSVNKG